jgi:hypothetical protein
VAEQRPIPLGRIVVEQGLLDEAQLELALAEHLATGTRLDEIFVEHGWLTEAQLAELVERQREDGAAPEGRSPGPGAAEEDEPDRSEPGHVLFVWSAAGYELLARPGEPPSVGSEVEVSAGRRVVSKVGPSPLPGDGRRCAFLEG